MGQFNGRRLSWLRLSVALVAIVALVATGFTGWHWFEDSKAAGEGKAWFAAYVDATTFPQLDFENPTTEATRDVVLSFIVASPGTPCAPSWGKDYTLDSAAENLDLDRRIARLRQNQGDVVVSFGGAINDELAVVCTDEKQLLKAYSAVVDRYDLRTIDLDLEGVGLTDTAATDRRAAAIAKLQVERSALNKDLRVWLTLPVAPSGLTVEGVQAVTSMLNAGVDLSGVNVMTMDYGGSRTEDMSMLDASTAALNATHRQLTNVYSAAGNPLGPATLWRRMGATPMIGQNDVPGEVFGLDAATELNKFATERGMGRLSMWSLNRDLTCGPNYPNPKIVSNSCSGVDQGSSTFAQALRGDLTDSPDKAAVTPNAVESETAGPVDDDPKNSPYPIWEEDVAYVEGTRIVWHRNVYVSKWWSTGDVPDDPTVDQFSSPWQLVGPVLPGEKPIPTPPLPAGTYPEWEAGTVYTTGERVLMNGVGFTAKWWTQGQSPTARSTQTDPSPWERLSDVETRKVLADADR
ncbi:MAG: carbohydrate-binding protein [Arachnia sp.]